MTPRTILYTGKGGVGKTSVAACTARRCAATGMRTLVLSTDPAHSLGESLGTALGPDPCQLGERLWGQQVQAQEELERHWAGVASWMGELLVDHGLDRIAAEELTVPPGMDELFALLRLREAHRDGSWDAIVVDCAPTGETLRLLSFPDAARWWLAKVFGREQQLLAAARPIARTLLDLPLPTGAVFADVRRLSERLIEMSEILRDSAHATVRLVMTPDRMVVGEAMRTFTYLNLYGFLTDAVIVNRVFPPGAGEYFAGWRAVQQKQLELVRAAFAPVPILRAPFFDREVVGAAMLERLAGELFDTAGAEPAAVLHDALTQELWVDDDGGAARLRLALPFARKGELSLKQVGLELVVTVAGQRRTIMLPPALAAREAVHARLKDGGLEVLFAPRAVAAGSADPLRNGSLA
jgi:arsenite-transporting ATPase